MSSNNAQAQAREHDRAVRRAERERAKRIARDEAAERRRAARSGFANVSNPRRSKLLTLVCAVFAVYCLFPFVYLAVNATKTQADFTSTFGLGFGRTFALWDNIRTVFTYDGGIFGRWLLNTILYVVVGAGARPCSRSWAATASRSSVSRDAGPCSQSSSARSACRASRWRSRSSCCSPS